MKKLFAGTVSGGVGAWLLAGSLTLSARALEADVRRDATVAAIEKVLPSVVNIATTTLVQYPDGEKRYIIAPEGLKVNDEIVSSKSCEIKVGNAMPLASIPPGIPICNVELHKGSGGIIARSAGNACIIMAKEGDWAHVKLPSGEIRLLSVSCYATIGQVGNIDHDSVSIGKAGRSRWMGKRPYSRGVAKNPHDHPMGGGEGKSSGGRHPTTPWGKKTKGLRTRKRKLSDKYIVKRRR